MTSDSLASARQIISAALAGGRSASDRLITVAVCDAGAHPLALAREDGAAALLTHIAQARTFTRIAYGKPTAMVREWAEQTPAWLEGVTNVAQSKMGMPLIGSGGGVTISDSRGRILGAVGVAGEAGEQDDRLARLGIEAAGYIPLSS